MKRNGFTLIELLGVIVILALLMILVFPSIINSVKKSTEETDELMLDIIYNASDLYISDHTNDFPKNNDNKYIIELQDLIDEGFLTAPIKLSDGTDITNNKCIQVTYNDDYNYELKESGTCEELDTIPDEYQQVEYIESSGTQYIDSEIIGGSNINFDIKVAVLDETSTLQRILGGYSDINTRYELYFSFVDNANRGISFNYYTGTYYTKSVPELGVPVVISKQESNLKVGDAELNLSSDTFSSSTKIFLFASNRTDTTGIIGRIYYTKIYDSDVIVRDFVPCYRISDNVVGMYDLVEDKFYTNQGEGTFEKGSNVQSQ